jgi:outer membrane biosynthesis protein TonB
LPSDRKALYRAARIAAILVFVGASIGLIAHSVSAIGYSVGSHRLNELAVTELSLTHAVQRGPDGKLFNPNETADESQVDQPKTDKSAAVAPLPKTVATEEMAAKKAPPKSKAKKPAPKKPTLKKPKPKKPVPKKPAPKPKGAGKACPT